MRNFWRLLIAALVFVGAVPQALAVGESTVGDSGNTVTGDATGTIVGTVTSNGAPIKTNISIYGANSGRRVAWFGSDPTTGGYSVELPAGDYTIWFQGYPPEDPVFGWADEWYDNQPGEQVATVVTVTEGASITANADLATGAALTVRMIDGDTLEPRIHHCLLIAWPSGGYRHSCTDDDGVVTISGIGHPSVRVMALPEDGYRNEWYDEGDEYETATPIPLNPGEESEVTLALDQGFASIAGIITDANTGLPIRGTEAVVYGYVAGDSTNRDNRFEIDFGPLDNDGSYRLDGLRTFHYEVWFSGSADDHLYKSEYFPDSNDRVGATPVATTVGETSRANGSLDYERCHGKVATVWDLRTGPWQGKHWFQGTPGDDVIIRSVDDRFYGEVVFRGGDGDDTMCGTGMSDEVFRGGPGNDFIRGRGGTDVIHGSSGDDIIFGGAGEDVIDGGHGEDSIWGRSGDDNITGDRHDDQVRGGLGFDKIRGNGGNDILRGGPGDDNLFGGAGANDSCFGGRGRNDTASGSCESVAGVKNVVR